MLANPVTTETLIKWDWQNVFTITRFLYDNYQDYFSYILFLLGRRILFIILRNLLCVADHFEAAL